MKLYPSILHYFGMCMHIIRFTIKKKNYSSYSNLWYIHKVHHKKKPFKNTRFHYHTLSYTYIYKCILLCFMSEHIFVFDYMKQYVYYYNPKTKFIAQTRNSTEYCAGFRYTFVALPSHNVRCV